MTVNSAANKTAETEEKNETLIIPVIEEKAFIEKQVVETGKVQISKRVSEHEKVIDEPLLNERVTVERVQVNQYVDEPPQVRHEGDTMFIPVVEEHLVVKKRLFLVEELRVRKEIVETHQPQSVTLRKEEIDVRRIAEDEISGD